MSVTATRPISFSIAERLHALVSPLFAGKSAQGRLYGDLKDLPDYLLLDIGVDPRGVPGVAHEGSTRPDLLWEEATAMTHRPNFIR
jgi:hypothetical protein